MTGAGRGISGRVIVKPRGTWLSLMFSWRGSVITSIWPRLLFVLIVSVVVEEAHRQDVIPDRITLTPLPFSLIGLALSIFLGFRNNTSYDRFWEGRKLWGRIVNTSRSLTRQILTLVASEDGATHRTLVYRLMGYVHALRLHLRTERDLSELAPFIGEARAKALEHETNPPIALLQDLGDDFAAEWRKGRVDAFHLPVLEASLTEFANIQGGCERIRATPIPFSYTVLMHRIVELYCLSLPFGIVSSVGVATPFVVGMIAYAFLALDAIGGEIEDPFGTDPNDLPLSQLSRMIEINLRERLGEEDLPDPVRPVDGVLS